MHVLVVIVHVSCVSSYCSCKYVLALIVHVCVSIYCSCKYVLALFHN